MTASDTPRYGEGQEPLGQTPRTDAARFDAEQAFGKFAGPQVFEHLARTLERELAAKDAEIARLRAALIEAQDAGADCGGQGGAS